MTERFDFRKKRFLIIDDYPEFRSGLKRMVEAMGGQEIDMAGNGDEALEVLIANKKKGYDVVLCDYNIGEGRDGQQVLEEAKYRELVKDSNIFIMLTAESTAEMVMGALEYEPDGYLIKPFTKEMLHTRLEKVAQFKEEMKEIYQAKEKKQLERAVELCDEKINAKSWTANTCLKLKCQLLVQLKQYPAVIELIRHLASEKMPWALLLIGEAYFGSEDYEPAQQAFEDLIDLGAVFVEAYDWLAKIQTALGDTRAAQKSLEKAIKISPKAILRQQVLGELALKNNDNDTAEKALRTAVGLGKNSCYRKADDFLNLAGTLMEKAQADKGIASKRAGTEALAVLENVNISFPDDLRAKAKSNIQQGKALIAFGNPDKAKLVLKRAADIIEKEEIALSSDEIIDYANSQITVGEKGKAETVLKKILGGKDVDSQVVSEIQEMAEKLELVVDEKSLNRQGIKLFEAGKLKDAAVLFEKATREMPDNISVNLNAAQAFIQWMQKEGKQKESLAKVKVFFERVKNIDATDKRYERYQQLQKMFKDVESGK
jgi:DNA-binding NarL/FixJ family response regulator